MRATAKPSDAGTRGDAALAGLLSLTRLGATAAPEQVIDAAAGAIAGALGYRTVVFNLYRRAFDDFRVVVVHGSAEAKDSLLGRVRTRESWEPLFDERHAVGGAYLVRHDAHDWSAHESYVPEGLPEPEDDGAWHPEDALFVPLRASTGELLGTLSVDEPEDGRRPDPGQLEVLASFASHVSVALERAHAIEDAARRGREVEELLSVSGRLAAQSSPEAVLEVVSNGIREALGFEKVAAYLAAGDGSLVLRAAPGWRPEDDVPAAFSVGVLEPLFASELLSEGCSLLPAAQAEALTPAAMHALYESESNGRGPHAWDHHWLVVPLRDAVGRLIGAVWCDEPRDRLRPDGARLKALRLFADQAVGALEAAARGEELLASERLHRSVVGALDEGVVVLDSDGRAIACNDSAAQIMGIGCADVLGRRPPWVTLFREDGTRVDTRTSPTARAAAAAAPLRDEVLRLTRPSGDDRWLSVNGAPLEDGGFVVSFTDITERRLHEQQIAHMAFHDGLTGLANRAQLEEHLALTLARARRGAETAAVLYVDLDDFKAVNDSIDHAAGDEVLRQVALRLADGLRAGDLLARQGGDEFLLLLPSLGPDPDAGAETVARNLLARLEAPFEAGSAVFEVGASVGVAVYPRDGEYPPELLRHADAALHQAKRAGGRTVAFYERGADDARGRLTASARLRRALAEDELVLHYQPVVPLCSDGPMGVEALVRWQDPERGLVPPLEFIALAERTGLIDLLGEWVLDAALEQSVAWSRAGLDVAVGVNVSPSQLRGDAFAERVLATIAESGAVAERVCLEVTESAAMRDAQRTAPVLAKLRAGGVRIAIDDFGADFSSLSRLRDLPVDVLKLDRSFLRGVPEEPAAGAMVKAILALADALGLDSVVEGIETPEQEAFARAHGCALGQGFHLGRPVPVEEATRVLAAASGALHFLK